MANGKRKRTVVSAGPVDALDSILATAGLDTKQPKQPGEFSVSDMHERLRAQGSGVVRSSVNHKLRAAELSGELLARVGPNKEKLYRKP